MTSASPGRPNVRRVLADLKDFQQASADYVFRRLYRAGDSTHRFLLADEVGLGKTLVARGVIAKAIDYLWDTTKRIDIVYICSNGDIARQNISRLDVMHLETALPTRLTLLPTTVSDLERNRVNFVSLTPGTSFDLSSGSGRVDERALLYLLVSQTWDVRATRALNVFQAYVTDHRRFRDYISEFRRSRTIDDRLADQFRRTLELDIRTKQAEAEPDIHARFEQLCDLFGRARKWIPPEQRREQNALIGEFRSLLAASCLEALEPDLIILDEFQRFKHLLSDQTPAGRLAEKLFEYSEADTTARVLLLSATPYKMYTIPDEAAGEDHYVDFIDTLRFLLHDERRRGRVEALLQEYREELYRVGEGRESTVAPIRDRLERELKRVMSRTERLALEADRGGMLVEVVGRGAHLASQDVQAYRSLQSVARIVDHHDTLEYWKSAPYLLNFMDQYKLKTEFKRAAGDGRAPMLATELRDADGLLSWGDIEKYDRVDPGNARLRSLWQDTVGLGAWRLLWMPPTLPYYEPTGPFADPAFEGLTKRLVFSSWLVVPKVLTCVLSYEAEREMMRAFEPNPENSADARKARTPLLRFTTESGRLTGLPVLGLLYPSATLAWLADPRRIASDLGRTGSRVTPSDVLEEAKRRIEPELRELRLPDEGGRPDENWYWAAPILMDLHRDGRRTREWFEERSLASIWAANTSLGDESDSGWAEHVEQARQVALGWRPEGPPPPDLASVLAQIAVGGPGVSSLRALSRVCGGEKAFRDLDIRDAAAAAAWGFRSLFNGLETMALLRGLKKGDRSPYWQLALTYCVEGNLQAVLDEYVHMLRDLLGVFGDSPAEMAEAVSKELQAVLALRTVALSIDEIVPRPRSVQIRERRMRGRFALRFGVDVTEDTGQRTREDLVRRAFNSPFWPFVLCTTSLGQEGLDFHPYCHAVVHWNLPSNPVDLEQREGRVHRYKGHAVRKNVAAAYGAGALESDGADPWEAIFTAAHADKPEGASDIIPFWVFQVPNGAKIERHVPALPLSRDRQRLEALRRSLAVYRMVFGQPRQEDLVSYLLARVPQEAVNRTIAESRIDLSPANRRTPAT